VLTTLGVVTLILTLAAGHYLQAWTMTLGPRNVTVAQRSGLVVLTWDPVTQANGYLVTYTPHSIGAPVIATQVSEPVNLTTALTARAVYDVRVASSIRGVQVGPWSAPITFTVQERQFPLAAPELKATPAVTSIEVTWAERADKSHYEIGVGTAPDDLTVVSTKTPRHTFRNLDRTTAYYLSARIVWDSGGAASAWSEPITVSTVAAVPLRVGSFNIHNAGLHDGPSWASRRKAVANTIAGQEVAVVGLQEANWTNVPGRRVSQYRDVLNLLGSRWRVTTTVGNSGPEGDRIIYDSSVVTMLRQGYEKLAGTHRSGNWRYVAWAEFRLNSTGQRFFFTNTHFLVGKDKKSWTIRRNSALQLVRLIKKKNTDEVPTIIVGDFNSHKFTTPSNAPHQIITAAGYVDPLDNIDDWRSTTERGIAEKRINAALYTANEYKRKALRNWYTTGVTIDQIYVSPMRVAEWETVAHIDSAGRFIGVIPSDHNMIRATVYLPS
jgi:endonuclease/exonuclease/phosphatase family metal-dependent hydrolase